MNLVDFDELDKLCGGDEEFRQEIFTNFIKVMPTYFNCLQISLVEENREDMLLFSYQLRALAKRCCVKQVEQQCLILEKQVEKNDFTAASETLQKIRQILRRIQDEYPPNISYLM